MQETNTATPESTGLVPIEEALTLAGQDGAGWSQAPQLLRDLEQALLSLSAGWHNLAPLAAPTVAALRSHEASARVNTGLSRGQEVHLMSSLHDLSTELTAVARSCRNTRGIVTPLIARRLAAHADDMGANGD